MKAAIQIEHLRKSYGNHTVLKGLDFQVIKGEIFALLGVNGAGKTTGTEAGTEGKRQARQSQWKAYWAPPHV